MSKDLFDATFDELHDAYETIRVDEQLKELYSKHPDVKEWISEVKGSLLSELVDGARNLSEETIDAFIDGLETAVCTLAALKDTK